MQKSKIIAEVSSNHSGNILLAKEFIKVAAEVGADYVKFQSSRYEDLADKNDPQAAWIQKTSLSDESHFELIEESKKHRTKFLTTCFSISRVDFLASLGLEDIKIASPDLLSFSMIERLAQHFKHLIISTGMHSIKEIKEAVDFLLKNKINATLLHAISIYPTPLEKSFMYKFLWLKEHFPHVGYSHHSPDIMPLQFALVQGAEIIEAHMKLGKNGPGRVTVWDVSPDGFKKIVKYRDNLEIVLGEDRWLKENHFLFSEEYNAREKFIGRWGDNR
jgi:sialic acid synthase SpsE